MQTQPKKHSSVKDETDRDDTWNQNDSTDTNNATEEDGSPVLDEEDLEENHIDEDEADDIEWEEPKE